MAESAESARHLTGQEMRQLLAHLHACAPGQAYARQFENPRQAWDSCPNGADLLWVVNMLAWGTFRIVAGEILNLMIARSQPELAGFIAILRACPQEEIPMQIWEIPVWADGRDVEAFPTIRDELVAMDGCDWHESVSSVRFAIYCWAAGEISLCVQELEEGMGGIDPNLVRYLVSYETIEEAALWLLEYIND